MSASTSTARSSAATKHSRNSCSARSRFGERMVCGFRGFVDWASRRKNHLISSNCCCYRMIWTTKPCRCFRPGVFAWVSLPWCYFFLPSTTRHCRSSSLPPTCVSLIGRHQRSRHCLVDSQVLRGHACPRPSSLTSAKPARVAGRFTERV